MNLQLHKQLKGHIWDIANHLRGPYRPPQYRLVMLPGDPENTAPNLVAYINGFSPIARAIFERFKFTDQLKGLVA